MAKYDHLRDFLAKQRGGTCTLTHANIEEILGARLPPSARGQRAWWGNEADGAQVQCHGWLDSGGGSTTAARRTGALCGSSARRPRRPRPDDEPTWYGRVADYWEGNPA